MEVITGVVTNVWTMFGTTITQFNENAVMWLPVGIGIVGSMIGLVRRATRVGGSRRR